MLNFQARSYFSTSLIENKSYRSHLLHLPFHHPTLTKGIRFMNKYAQIKICFNDIPLVVFLYSTFACIDRRWWNWTYTTEYIMVRNKMTTKLTNRPTDWTISESKIIFKVESILIINMHWIVVCDRIYVNNGQKKKKDSLWGHHHFLFASHISYFQSSTYYVTSILYYGYFIRMLFFLDRILIWPNFCQLSRIIII